eukprot:366228-Chlamydomonas_euryale.AAC.35
MASSMSYPVCASTATTAFVPFGWVSVGSGCGRAWCRCGAGAPGTACPSSAWPSGTGTCCAATGCSPSTASCWPPPTASRRRAARGA